MTNPIEKWHEIVKSGNTDLLSDILDENCIFYSPVVFSPQKGKKITQGEVIGYVGQTGLATGPHVCYRFWKNGKQVDHLREEFPPSTPIKTESMADYERCMIQLREDIEKTQKVR